MKNNKKVNEKKQNIVLVLVLILVIGLVIYGLVDCINFFRGKKDGKLFIPEENSAVEEIKDYKTVDVNGLYYNNPIKIVYQKNKEVDPSLGIDCSKYEALNDGIEYITIDGLKDEKIENEINEKIKNDIEKFVSNYLKNNNEVPLNEVKVLSNFNNVLSIKYSINASYDEILFINLDLNTGKDIVIKDLYNSKDFNLRDNIYKALKEDNEIAVKYYGLESLSDEEVNNNANKVNEEIESGKIKFGFTPSYINLICPDNKIANMGEVICNFKDFSDKVCIYDRFFENQDIYDGQYKKVGPFNNLTLENYCKDKILEEKDNYYMNMSVTSFDGYANNINDKVLETASKIMNNKSNEFKEVASKNPDKFYIFNASIYVLLNIEEDKKELEDKNLVEFSMSNKIYELSKEEYDSKYKNEIISQLQKNNFEPEGAENVISFEDLESNKSEYKLYYIDVTNGEVVKTN